MSMKVRKSQRSRLPFDREVWLARLAASSLTAAERKLAERLLELALSSVHGEGRKRRHPRWVDGWQVRWEGCSDTMRVFGLLRQHNLAVVEYGSALVVLGPATFGPKSIQLSVGAALLLRTLLRPYWGELYRVNRPGYITRPDDPRRWWAERRRGSRVTHPKIDQAAADELAGHGLIESDGCGHGWPFQYTNRMRVARHLMYAIANRGFAQFQQRTP
jgi:hypothetical protein